MTHHEHTELRSSQAARGYMSLGPAWLASALALAGGNPRSSANTTTATKTKHRSAGDTRPEEERLARRRGPLQTPLIFIFPTETEREGRSPPESGDGTGQAPAVKGQTLDGCRPPRGRTWP